MSEVFFVSRAGQDTAVSEIVGDILRAAGYEVILQQHGFANTSFIAQMHGALQGGARVIALLSPAYLNSDYCAAEWQSVLADDPLNNRSRLIVLRIATCAPPGLLKALAYWDLVGVDDARAFERIVLEAVGAKPVDGGAGRVAVPATLEREPTERLENLPAQLTAFIGRAAVVAEIKAQIESVRLVTVLGAGGIGKTRTALEVAAQLLDGSGDGVWFVDFAPLGSGTYVVAELASVFGVREQTGKPLLDGVLAYLAKKRLLLVLDNCEHVVAEARALAEAILRHCPEVRIIATSREPLAAQGEATYKLPTLAVPARDERVLAADALRYEALALFTARAQAVEKRFVLTDASVVTVADICRRLDGIALAIELAASRVRILTLVQLDRMLDERFRLLTGGSKSALPRQQTMRALIDWSYDLLDAPEQEFFRKLSIFAGGWTLEAATAVCAAAGDDEFTILDRLMSLTDKSLVTVDYAEEAQRFRFLESMRAYAFEAARASGEYAALERAHADYYAEFVRDDTMRGIASAVRLDAIEAESENLRDVLRWSIERGADPQLGARVAFELGRFWSMRRPREGQRWLQLARAALAPSDDPKLIAMVDSSSAAMLPYGSFERIEATERALRSCRVAADPMLLTRALAAYGEQLSPIGHYDEARSAFEEALAYARTIDSDWNAGRALAGLGDVALETGDLAAGRAISNEALAAFERVGAIDGIAYVSSTLSNVEFRSGNVQRAIELGVQARASMGKLNNHRSGASVASYLAAISLITDAREQARFHARDAIALLQNDRHPLFLAEAIEPLGLLATLSGEPERGALLLGYAEAAYGRLAHPRTVFFQTCHDRLVGLLTEALGTQKLSECKARSAALAEDTIIAEALAV